MDICKIATWPVRFIITAADLLATSSPDRRGFLRAMKCIAEVIFKAPEVGADLGTTELGMKFCETFSSWKKIFENKFKSHIERSKVYADALYNIGAGVKIGMKYRWIDLGRAIVPFGVTILITDIAMAALAIQESSRKIYKYQTNNEFTEVKRAIDEWKSGKREVKQKHIDRMKDLSDDERKVQLLQKWEARLTYHRGEYYGGLLNLPFQVAITALGVSSAVMLPYTPAVGCVVTFFGLCKLGVKTVSRMDGHPYVPRKNHNKPSAS